MSPCLGFVICTGTAAVPLREDMPGPQQPSMTENRVPDSQAHGQEGQHVIAASSLTSLAFSAPPTHKIPRLCGWPALLARPVCVALAASKWSRASQSRHSLKAQNNFRCGPSLAQPVLSRQSQFGSCVLPLSAAVRSRASGDELLARLQQPGTGCGVGFYRYTTYGEW